MLRYDEDEDGDDDDDDCQFVERSKRYGKAMLEAHAGAVSSPNDKHTHTYTHARAHTRTHARAHTRTHARTHINTHSENGREKTLDDRSITDFQTDASRVVCDNRRKTRIISTSDGGDSRV